MPSTLRATGLIPAILTVAALSIACPASAQEEGSGSDVSLLTDSVTGIPLLTIHFGGGTAADFVDVLREAVGDEANIVGDERLAYLPMPGVDLKNVSVQSALALLDGSRFSGGGAEHVASLNVLQMLPDEMPIHTIQVESHNLSPARSQVTDLGVWPASGIMERGFTADDILTSVHIALELTSEGDDQDRLAPTIRFHEQTGLLIVYGSPQVLSQVERIMDAIEESAYQRTQSSTEGMEQRLAEMEEALAAAQAHVAQSTDQLQETTTDLATREAIMSRLEEELSRRTNEVERTQQMLLELERRAAQQAAELEALRAETGQEPAGDGGGTH